MYLLYLSFFFFSNFNMMNDMDSDWAIPEPFIPLIFAGIALWGWVTVLCILQWQHMDVKVLLQTNVPCEIKPFVIFATSFTLLVGSHIVFSEHTRVFEHYEYSPVILCYILTAALGYFGQCRLELDNVIKCLHRLFFQLRGDVSFADVMVADILISYSGALTGIFVKVMHLVGLPACRFVPYVQW